MVQNFVPAGTQIVSTQILFRPEHGSWRMRTAARRQPYAMAFFAAP